MSTIGYGSGTRVVRGGFHGHANTVRVCSWMLQDQASELAGFRCY